MTMRRREFLGTAVAGATGAFLAGQAAAAPADLDPTAGVPLCEGVVVSRIGFGTGMRGWERSSNQTRLGEEHFDNLLHYAYDHNIRFFDLADIYGSHDYVARAFRDKPRDSYVVSTKIWWRKGGVPDEDKKPADQMVQRFLKELNTDYIDVVQLHCMTSPTWTSENRRDMDLLEDCKRKGLIRAHGCSCHSIGALEAAAAEPWVDVVHTRINPFGLKMDGKPEDVVASLKKLHAAGKGIIGMKIIGEGDLRDDDQRREQSVHFVLGLGVVNAMIVGFEQTWEMDDIQARVKRALTALAPQDKQS